MKTTLINALAIAFAGATFFSCSSKLAITKRLYQSGYNIEFSESKDKPGDKVDHPAIPVLDNSLTEENKPVERNHKAESVNNKTETADKAPLQTAASKNTTSQGKEQPFFFRNKKVKQAVENDGLLGSAIASANKFLEKQITKNKNISMVEKKYLPWLNLYFGGLSFLAGIYFIFIGGVRSGGAFVAGILGLILGGIALIIFFIAVFKE